MNAPKQINNAPPHFFSKITDLRMTSLTNPSWVSSREELVNQSAAERNNDLHDNVADFLFETRLWTCAAWSNFGSGNRIYRNWSMVLSLSAQKTAGGKKEKENGRAVHRAGNHTITLTVFLSAACSLPFSFTNFDGKKPLFLLFLFPPVDISSRSTDSLANFASPSFTNAPSSSSFLPSSSSSCWQITLSSGTLFHLATPASLFCHFTFTQTANLLHFPSNFQMNFTGTDWRSPFTSLFTISLCFCFEFSFRELYWHHSMTVTLSLFLSHSHSLLCLSPSIVNSNGLFGTTLTSALIPADPSV